MKMAHVMHSVEPLTKKSTFLQISKGLGPLLSNKFITFFFSQNGIQKHTVTLLYMPVLTLKINVILSLGHVEMWQL